MGKTITGLVICGGNIEDYDFISYIEEADFIIAVDGGIM